MINKTNKNIIIYYDFNDINYSSFFLTGFHQNSEIFGYKFIVSKSVPYLLCDKEIIYGWNDIFFSICLFKIIPINGEEFFFCIDTRDSCVTDRGKGYHLPLLKKVKFYFKVNYNIDAINKDANLKEFSNKIIPALPFFPIKCPKILSYLPRPFPSEAVNWTFSQAKCRLRTLGLMLPLEQIKKFRNYEKNLDVFFVTRYYDEEIHAQRNEICYQIMREIQKCPQIKSFVGFNSRKKILNSKYAEFQVQTYSFKEYLRLLATSRVAIYVRGVHNCISFKFGELLALGKPIVGQTINNNSENIMDNPYFRDQFAFDEPKAIVEEMVKLIKDPERQKMLGESNAKVFDNKFSPQVTVENILSYFTNK